MFGSAAVQRMVELKHEFGTCQILVPYCLVIDSVPSFLVTNLVHPVSLLRRWCPPTSFGVSTLTN
jgi:hypothetical protein